MTTRNKARSSSERGSRGSFVPFALGVLSTLLVLAVGGAGYLRYGHAPVAVADRAFPGEARLVQVPLEARVSRESKRPPFGISEEVFETGAKVYERSCATEQALHLRMKAGSVAPLPSPGPWVEANFSHEGI